MDPISPLPARSALTPSVQDLHRELSSLRLAVQIMLVSLVILTGALGVYLFRQVSLLRRQADASRRLAETMYQNYNLNVATQAQNLEKELLAFANTNAEFRARLARFYPSNAAPATASASAPAPAPAPAP